MAVHGDCTGTLRKTGRRGIPVSQLAALEHPGDTAQRRGFPAEQCGSVQVHPRPDAAPGEPGQNCQGDRTGSGSAGETGEGLVHSSVLRLCGDQRPGSLLQIPGLLQRQSHGTECADRDRRGKAVRGLCGLCGTGTAPGRTGLCRRGLSPCRKGSLLCGVCRPGKPEGTSAECGCPGTAGISVRIRHLAKCLSERCV